MASDEGEEGDNPDAYSGILEVSEGDKSGKEAGLSGLRNERDSVLVYPLMDFEGRMNHGHNFFNLRSLTLNRV